MDGQTELETGHRRRTLKQTSLADFEGPFPKGVFPTEARLVYNRGHFLVYHQYGMEEMPHLHRRMWKALASLNHPDANGSLTVLCVWGNINVAARYMQRFDWQGEHSKALASTDAIKAALSDWWRRSAR